MNALVAAYIPYEQNERYAYGERVNVPLRAAFGAILCLALMVCYIWKTQKEKREGKSETGHCQRGVAPLLDSHEAHTYVLILGGSPCWMFEAERPQLVW